MSPRRSIHPLVLAGGLAALTACATFQDCVHGRQPMTLNACWAGMDSGFNFHFAAFPDAGTRAEQRLSFVNDEKCRRYFRDVDAGEFDPDARTSNCKTTFDQVVTFEFCTHVAALNYCNNRCASQPASACLDAGIPTLSRRCAEANLQRFVELVPYCAGVRLENAALVGPAPDSGIAPACR